MIDLSSDLSGVIFRRRLDLYTQIKILDLYFGRDPEKGAGLEIKRKEIPHAMFKRDGSDLELVQEVSLHQALSGGTAKIPLLDQSEYVLHFDALTTTASTMRLKGKGMPISKTPGQFGDLVIKFEVALPTGRSRQNIAKILAS